MFVGVDGDEWDGSDEEEGGQEAEVAHHGERDRLAGLIHDLKVSRYTFLECIRTRIFRIDQGDTYV